jgi:acylphosphatase
MEKGLEIQVIGKVQGVWFRASVQREAKTLGLTGWVQNEPDGSVRLQAHGAETDLRALAEWCHRGPAHAIVEKVVVSDIPCNICEDFVIRRR